MWVCENCNDVHPVAGECPFCDRPLTKRRKRRVTALLSDDEVRALHRLYEEGYSTAQLAERFYEAKGYKSMRMASRALLKAFKRLGLPARDRYEASMKANVIHGMRSRDNGDQAGYQRWRRRQQGLLQPQCEGIRSQYPNKGERCENHAMFGSKYCYAHDPEKSAQRDAHLVEARRRSKI